MDENRHIADRLREAAALIESQGASPFRVAAYRHAADAVAHWRTPLRALFDAQGRAGLQTIPGVGAGISSSIAEMLITGSWSTLEALRGGAHAEPAAHAAPHREAPAVLPSVALLLEIDREYRDKAAAGRLPLIAPRRFNPQGKAWLPVLHAHRGDWHLTALFSNTERAHELGHTHDWVVIYFYDGDHREGRCTVVTETHGEQAGRRVVRGREWETEKTAA
jgi:hypothetical protein